ncbi:hypothetical protein FB45DRAFT_1017950 [Roridomyces roridus]|uniref:Uncharacterized protein n=1 Tax=Roridomyces roridus TaxID=1738132 RepID=A0AAD7CJS2_9AGAR|nr:hypothetical protein FB45DRAFT_1017950 [Roridomyces roridus]
MVLGAPAAALGDGSEISCHIVLKQTGKNDVEEVFTGIDFPTDLLVRRKNTLCTTLLALITQLQKHKALLLSCGISIDSTITMILDQKYPFSSDIQTATTRAPCFDELLYRKGSNGFRQLGSFQTSFSDPVAPAHTFDSMVDVMAASGSGYGARDFFDMWEGMGVHPESHFILMFIINTPFTTFFPPLDTVTFEVQPEILPFISDPFHPPPIETITPFSTLSSPSRSSHEHTSGLVPYPSPPAPESPTSQMETSTFTPPTIPVAASRSSPLRVQRARSESVAPYPSPQHHHVKGICEQEILDFATLQPKATFTNGTRANSIAEFARCFNSMKGIILSLQLDPELLKQSRSFLCDSTEVALSGEQVLQYFRWTTSTFVKKRQLFAQARSLASRRWKGAIPGDSESDTDKKQLHNTLRAIHYLWSEDGPITNLDLALPSKHSKGDEKLAADLTQANLESSCKALKDFTEANN